MGCRTESLNCAKWGLGKEKEDLREQGKDSPWANQTKGLNKGIKEMNILCSL